MKKEISIDEEIFPPFEGIPVKGIEFLKKLKRNNNRIWFNKHKSEYEDFVKLPTHSLISSLKYPMSKFAPEIEVNPKRSIFRIYRDTRFSKDKKPYKTHTAAVFHLKGHWQRSAGYYIHIEPGNIYAGGGIYMPDGNQLKLIRHAIAEHPEEFCSIVESKIFQNHFQRLKGEKLSRAPLGYPPTHPMIEWLKHKSFYAGVEWKEKECYNSKFIDKIVAVYKELFPLIRFLNEALGKSEP